MERLGFEEKSLPFGTEAILTDGAERPGGSATTEVLTGSDLAYSVGGEIAAHNTMRRGCSEVNSALSPLQIMIQEILDPDALYTRPVKNWRNLYKSFFVFFAPGGGADEMERKAWAIAVHVFNTNLVAVRNRTSQIVPMTFQDFVDGVDSFRHDGLQEGAQRDIAWQPKKILLLMAAMIGRIVAGWQADVGLAREPRQDLLPFRNYLISVNRKAAFLGSVFDYDPRFSIQEYQAAGLRPLLHPFPHFAHGILENGIRRCEFCASQVAGNPPILQVHFRKPLRALIPSGIISVFHIVLLRKPPAQALGNHPSGAESLDFENSTTLVEALAFASSESLEGKCSKIERLFELAVTNGLLICGPHRPGASTAGRIGRTLGRTQAEKFVIEQFFALGFRNGYGNEPWLQQRAREPSKLDPEKVKTAWKRFKHWRDILLFFFKAGQPQAAEFVGARIRQEALQPKRSDLFLSLLNTPVYAPLMSVFLEGDAQGSWLVDEPELHAFARSLNTGTGRVLLEVGAVIVRCADSFQDQETKGVFLFECAVGIWLSVTSGPKTTRRQVTPEKVKDALRKGYERLVAVSLSAAPSVLWANRDEIAARLVETRKRFEQAEERIMSLLAEPLSKKVLEHLQATLAALPKQTSGLVEQPVPRIRVESPTMFEESVIALYAWIKSTRNQAPSAPSPSTSQLLVTLVELRALAEEGEGPEALEKASLLYPTLSETRKQALAPFVDNLFWSLLQAIEQQLELGHNEKAIALAKRVKAMIERMPSRSDFKSLLDNIVAPKRAQELTATPGPSNAASASGAEGARVHQAEALLCDHAEELGMVENQLEHEFLEAVREGSDAAFRRKDKLKNRLQRRTRWGGREPYKTTLKLLESITTGCDP